MNSFIYINNLSCVISTFPAYQRFIMSVPVLPLTIILIYAISNVVAATSTKFTKMYETVLNNTDGNSPVYFLGSNDNQDTDLGGNIPPVIRENTTTFSPKDIDDFGLYFKSNRKEILNWPILFKEPLPSWLQGTLVSEV